MNTNKIKIAGTQYDGRCALSPLEKQLVISEWNTGKWTLNKLANKYQVSRNTVSRAVGRPQKVRTKGSYRYDPTNKLRTKKTREKKRTLFSGRIYG